MFVPFVSKKRLFRRKGGGGKGSKGGGRNSGQPRSSTIVGSGTSRSASAYGKGGGRVTSIPAGQPFSGRSQGGGTRNQVFGSRVYGSGYPGVVGGLGVAGRGFPFYFWPVVWGGTAIGGGAYLHNGEYGSPDNSSRPGGIQETATFQSNYTGTIFRVLSDNTTVAALITTIGANCSSHLTSNTSSSPTPFNASTVDGSEPEQAVEYYRASSVVLTLDGYNNTEALTGKENFTNAPLPSGIDTSLLDCLNQTIGFSVPLIDAATTRWATPGMGIIETISVFWIVFFLLFT